MGDLQPQVPEFRNRPAQGVMVAPDQIGWELRTEENVHPLVQKATPENWGDPFELTLKKRGVYKKALVTVKFGVTVANGTGTTTLRDIFPHGILRALNLNGDASAIHELNGWLAHAYMCRRNRNPDVSGVNVLSDFDDTTPANGAYEGEFTLEIPMTYDYATGVGSTYGETDQAEFTITGALAHETELFARTGNASAVVLDYCTINASMVFWDVPRDLVDGVDVLFVPDLSRLFQLQMRNPVVDATGPFELNVLNVHGNLTALIMALRNNSANHDIAQGGLTELAWGYGANLYPRRYRPTEHLLWENARMYDGLLPYKTFALDFDSENPRRDSTRPPGLTELVVKAEIPSSVTLTNARFYALHESLVAAENGPATVQSR